VSGLTNSQLLPYQTGGDDRCDAASYPEQGIKGMWQQFVERVEAKLTPLALTANRLTNVPLAFVEWFPDDPTVGLTVGRFESDVPWNSVTADTDNMVDIDADPLHVYPPRPGYYSAWAMARCVSNVANYSFGLTIGGSVGTDSTGDFWLIGRSQADYIQYNTDPGSIWSPPDVFAHRLILWDPDAVGVNVDEGISVGLTGDNGAPITYVSLGVAWHSEL
jgi:hypothetical protein